MYAKQIDFVFLFREWRTVKYFCAQSVCRFRCASRVPVSFRYYEIIRNNGVRNGANVARAKISDTCLFTESSSTLPHAPCKLYASICFRAPDNTPVRAGHEQRFGYSCARSRENLRIIQSVGCGARAKVSRLPKVRERNEGRFSSDRISWWSDIRSRVYG